MARTTRRALGGPRTTKAVRIPAGPRKEIVVNRHVADANRRREEREPCLTAKCQGRTTYGHEIVIRGESRLVQRPEEPRGCGATVWLETTAELLVLTTTTTEEP